MPIREPIFNNSFANYKISKENQRIFLNNTEIIGAQSISFNERVPFRGTPHMGMSKTNQVIRGISAGSTAIGAFVLGTDQLIQYTGEVPATGYFLSSQYLAENHLGVIFTPSYLTSYTFNYALNEIPTVSTEFITFDNFGGMNASDLSSIGTGITDSTPSYTIKLPNQGSVSLSLSEFTTNRVLSFNVGIRVNRVPAFSLGRLAPYRVFTEKPIEAEVNFTLALGTYDMKNLSRVYQDSLPKSIQITMNDGKTQANITSFNFSDMMLWEESLRGDTDSLSTVSLKYGGFIL